VPTLPRDALLKKLRERGVETQKHRDRSPVFREKDACTLSRSLLERFCVTYVIGPNDRVTIHTGQDHLLLVDKERQVELFPESERVFSLRMPTAEITVTFTPLSPNIGMKLTMKANGQTILEGKRIRGQWPSPLTKRSIRDR